MNFFYNRGNKLSFLRNWEGNQVFCKGGELGHVGCRRKKKEWPATRSGIGNLDNALYPVLFLDYFRPSLAPAARAAALAAITNALTFLNYRCLHIVGISAILIAAFSLSFFVALALLALPHIQPRRWLAVNFRRINWRGYFSGMVWNLNYWDKASTLAGKVEDPTRTFPRALYGAVVLMVASYLIPLLAGTGAMDESKAGEWTDGYFVPSLAKNLISSPVP